MSESSATAAPEVGPLPRPPSPPRNPLLGHLPYVRKNAVGFLREVAATHGDVVRLKLVVTTHLLGHPDHVRHVLQDNQKNYAKGWGYTRMVPLVGKGLLTSEGDFWRRQRRLAQPAFHHKRLEGFAAQMVARTAAMVDAWDGRPEVDVHAEMMRLTLSIVGDALFGVDLAAESERSSAALTTTLEVINDRLMSPWAPPRWIPTPTNRRFYKAIGVLDELVETIIAGRRRDAVEHHDLLGMFMAIQDADTGERMDDRQLRDEVMTMVLAGHETTANALAWTWLLLAQHPEAERRLHAELDEVLGDRDPTVADLPRLVYTTRVIHEAMRLYPPAWVIGRRALEDDEIGGFKIRAGESTLMLPYNLHRDARWWPDPERFDPDRFAPEVAATRPKCAYLPFAAGPRMCIGSAFATMEMQIAVAMVARRYRLAIDAATVEPDFQITLRPKQGVAALLAPR
jgi:cytochrome P450